MTIRRGSTKPEVTKPGVESEILQESQAQQKATATMSSREESRVLQELQARYPEVRWVVGKRFSFRPPRTIQLGEPQSHYVQLVLHELGHCLAGHRDFRTDIGRLQLEREAWERAHAVWRELHLEEQGIEWDADFVEAELDTYRDWLHVRSRCPRCGATRFQTIDGVYHCPFCAEFGSRKA